MDKKDFCHLHVHSEYSILDGINRLDKLAEYVAKQGMSSCAVTDHGVLHGVIEWYKSGQDAKINPIIGVEAYLTDDEDGIESNKDKTRDNYHCILLATNEEGLRNLFWLTNMANLNNFYYRPRISIGNLDSRNSGIIATSSCLGGIAAKRGQFNRGVQSDQPNGTFTDNDSHASRCLERFAAIFNGRFYCEIQDNPEFWQQGAYNRWLINAARERNLPLVITSDAHWLTKQDKDTHDMIMAQQLKTTIEEYKKRGDEDGLYYGAGHYIRSPEEMYQAALKYNCEEAFWNASEIAKQCKVDIKLGEYETPIFNITKEDDYEDFKQWRTSQLECSPTPMN